MFNPFEIVVTLAARLGLSEGQTAVGIGIIAVVIGLSVQNERHVEEAMTRAGAAVFVTKERAAGQLYEAIVRTVRTRK